MSDPRADRTAAILDGMGDRGQRRPEPRASISLAGAGCALGILGVLVLAVDTGIDDDTGEFSQMPGIVLSALVVALGYFVLSRLREGPIATAGTVAAALGVPAFMFFVTFDDNGFPPYNIEAILIVSTVVWLGSYVVGPARGRPFFLGAGLIGLWFTVLELVENVFDVSPAEYLFGFGYGYQESTFESSIDSGTGETIVGGDFGGANYDPPDPAVLGLLSLALGVGFLFVARWLDRDHRHGAGTPFTFAAIPCLAAGVAGLAGDLEAAGCGLLLTAIGLALAWHGASVWRRATSWIGGATMALGLALFLGDMAGDSATTGGMLFLAGGIAMVFGGHLLQSALNEPDELAVTTGALIANGPMRQVVATEPIPPPPGPPAVDTDADPDAPWKPPPPLD